MQEKPNREAQLKELERELKMRWQVYPKWVRSGRMTEEQKAHRIACLTEVIQDFKARHNPGSQQGSLGI